MEIVSILRVLRRHRLVVLAGFPVAILVGLSMIYSVSLSPPGLGSRQQSSAVALQRVLISTPDLPTFALDSDSHGTLPTRAILLADLLTTDVARVEIARDAGIDPDQLTVLGPDMGPSPLEITLATAATEAAGTPSGPYLLTASADGKIPIITLSASAPDDAIATKLARAANRSLRRTISARSGTVPGLKVQRLGLPVAKTLTTGPKKAMGAIATLLLMVLWTTSVIIFFALRARRRPTSPWIPAGDAA